MVSSGVRKLFKYAQIYSKNKPVLIEEDIFKIIIPLTEQATEQAIELTNKALNGNGDRIKRIMTFCKTAKSTSEIMIHIGLTHREHFRSDILQPMIKEGLLQPTISDKPSSPNQKYLTTSAGRAFLEKINKE